MSLTGDLKRIAIELGADSIGVASVAAYSERVPNQQKPDFLASGMQSIVVLTKHLLTGCLAVEDVATQSTNSHLSLDLIDETLYGVAEWLEDRGHAALPISPEYADMDLVWTGGGLLDLKWTAEFAGLGHVGLNLNFLSPDYGSRVYLAALVTDAVLDTDSPLDHDLCPGLDCGRCGVLCPPKAIPLEAPRDQTVNDYRNLDQNGCSQAAMRISIRSLYSVLRKLLGAGRPLDADVVLDNRYWQDYYLATNSKRGAFAACFECMYVCPVGAKDIRKIMRIPYRRRDLPPGAVKHIRTDELHTVQFLGPPKDRDPEYIRDRDFDHLVQIGAAS
jgi:epoxyqueuosine reductase QueG